LLGHCVAGPRAAAGPHGSALRRAASWLQDRLKRTTAKAKEGGGRAVAHPSGDWPGRRAEASPWRPAAEVGAALADGPTWRCSGRLDPLVGLGEVLRKRRGDQCGLRCPGGRQLRGGGSPAAAVRGPIPAAQWRGDAGKGSGTNLVLGRSSCRDRSRLDCSGAACPRVSRGAGRRSKADAELGRRRRPRVRVRVQEGLGGSCRVAAAPLTRGPEERGSPEISEFVGRRGNRGKGRKKGENRR
jgi:hypothetical protein